VYITLRRRAAVAVALAVVVLYRAAQVGRRTNHTLYPNVGLYTAVGIGTVLPRRRAGKNRSSDVSYT